jgi:hypothetical protein
MHKNNTYLSTESFSSDSFSFHDERFLTNPNAIYDAKDSRGEMAAKVLLCALAHNYNLKDQRNGPFLLQFDELQASNIFVDNNWNRTYSIDLEWVSALSVERLALPYWITGCGIGGIREERLGEFNKSREESMEVFEERRMPSAAKHGLSFSQIMRESWKAGGVWFWQSIISTNAMYFLLVDHICPQFSSRLLFKEEEILSRFWSENAVKAVEARVKEQKD